MYGNGHVKEVLAKDDYINKLIPEKKQEWRMGETDEEVRYLWIVAYTQVRRS